MASCVQNLFLRFCICFCGLSLINGGRPVVTSIVRMSRLADFERDLVSYVRQRAPQFPPQFVNFVSSVEEEYARTYDYTLSFIDFPINQYRLIRRFSNDWLLWFEQLKILKYAKQVPEVYRTPATEFLNFYEQLSMTHDKIDKFNPSLDLPTAVISVTRLHILYRSKTGLLSNEEPTGCPPLSQIELLELCAAVLRNRNKDAKDIYYAFHWMTLFIDRMEKYLPYSSVMFMVEYVFKHSDIYGRPKHHHRTLAVESEVNRLARVTWLMEKFPQQLQMFYDEIDEDLDSHVCRSSSDRSEHGNYCFTFHTPRSPYAPFKYEILHRDPYVAVVHNFMPIQTAQNFVSTANAKGSDVNKVVSSYSSDDGRAMNIVKAKTRLSESTVFEHDHPVNEWLDLRVEHATLLLPHSQPMRYGVRDGETNQIQHYGLSGHYLIHHDYFPENSSPCEEHGNRLATVLVYLSDVYSGGHTAFPLLNVSLRPRAGSALVWFNLDPANGTPLPDTVHTGCPVNIGKKWVINRWILSHLKTGRSRPVLK